MKAQVAVGVSADDAGATFDRLTRDGGKLTMEMLVTAVGQFYRDEAGADSGIDLFFGSL